MPQTGIEMVWFALFAECLELFLHGQHMKAFYLGENLVDTPHLGPIFQAQLHYLLSHHAGGDFIAHAEKAVAIYRDLGGGYMDEAYRRHKWMEAETLLRRLKVFGSPVELLSGRDEYGLGSDGKRIRGGMTNGVGYGQGQGHEDVGVYDDNMYDD
ncbi:Hypothetical protein D9617_11g008570 [Elsinoe fawcettii]|nr:Hypothetical protein D9617_11g008570 [Elsinoe fawcettii]